MADVIDLDPNGKTLACTGACRDGENPKALCFTFNRRPTDNEMRFIHEALRRTAHLTDNIKK